MAKSKKSSGQKAKGVTKQNTKNKSTRPRSGIGFERLLKEDGFHFIVLIISVLSFLLFGLNHLGQFFTTDETVWLFKRFPHFWDSIEKGIYSGSTEEFGNSGVLQSWLSSGNFSNGVLVDYGKIEFEDFLFQWRLPLLLFNTGLLLVSYTLVRKLTNKDVALIALILMSLFPFLIGISQVFSKDSTLWSTAYCSFLSFLLYLKTDQKKYVFLFGLFLGMALLTKFPASIFYAMFLIFLYCEYVFKYINNALFLRKIVGLVVGFLISIFVVFLLNPATWSSLTELLEWTILATGMDAVGPILLVFFVFVLMDSLIFKGKFADWLRSISSLKGMIVKTLGMIVVLMSVIAFLVNVTGLEESLEVLKLQPVVGNSLEIQSFFPAFYDGFSTFIFETPLLISGGVIGALLLEIRGKDNGVNAWHQKIVTYFLILIISYFVGTAFTGFTLNIRYQSLLIPIYVLVASLFYYEVVFTKFSKKWAVVLILVVSLVEVARVSPFYISYRSIYDIKSLGQDPSVSWGQGGYEIAKAANQLSDLNSAVVLSDYDGFNRFYLGKSERYDFASLPNGGFLALFDYLCLSSNGQSQISRNKSMTPDLKSYYDQPLNEAIWYVGNKDHYVKFVKVTK